MIIMETCECTKERSLATVWSKGNKRIRGGTRRKRWNFTDHKIDPGDGSAMKEGPKINRTRRKSGKCQRRGIGSTMTE